MPTDIRYWKHEIKSDESVCLLRRQEYRVKPLLRRNLFKGNAGLVCRLRACRPSDLA
jgi:hypothetical protein